MRDVVAVLSPFVGGDYYGGIIRGVNDAAVADGARVIAVQTLDSGARSADGNGVPEVVSPIAARLYDGAVVLPGAIRGEHARALQDVGLPLVLIGHELPGVVAPSVRSDNHSGVRAAVGHLVEHGHREIGFGGFLDVWDIRERYDAYVQGLLDHGLHPSERLLLHASDNHEAGGVVAAEQLLAAGPPARAVVLGTDRNAIGLTARLREAGLDVPRDVAVVGFDDVPACRYESPGLTSVRQPLEMLGAVACALVRSLAAGHEPPPEPVCLPARLVVRASCGCPGRGLQLTEAEARAQFESLTLLQSTLNAQYDLDVELLGTGQTSPRSLGWLRATPVRAGVLGLWLPERAGTDPATAGPDPATGAGPAAEPDPGTGAPHAEGPGPFVGARALTITGAYSVGTPLPVPEGSVVADVDFPPLPLLDQADGADRRIVFVVPIRGQAWDWGLLAAVCRIQDDTPAGREMMNHSGAVLTAALDREVMIASLRSQQEELHRLALHDQLTGLPNRAQLDVRLAVAADRSRTDPSFRYSVLFLDLDGFKAINDTYGHAAGDRLLTTIAQRLHRVTRDTDMVARFGGDEFLVLIEGIDDRRMLRALVRRMRRTVRRPVVLEGRPVHPGVSIGVVLSADGENPQDLLRRADAAMYRAKARRRTVAARQRRTAPVPAGAATRRPGRRSSDV